jgi:hypothetical protein
MEDRIREAVARGWCHPETEDRTMDAELAEAIAGEVTLELQQVVDLTYRAWTIIANANQGNWEGETEEWQGAAARWRDDFHNLLREIVNA